ncbi:T9SS type A sorting domain-containing protein [Hymenobacter lapidiphilus]|uniref:T9SS type A sorting domain-containing protein n=1 Tax=Hymenobacter lapidiphilus TaxID=2608003 RepID=A0A7Y7U510_9BACT|nr:T9SS type A sorting domain-containing protein [Hymenobacter lapidiphilus]NVO29985.1 T9SS type A sorting domain-containing protein [Hymenobacter lapidiphilus]
MKTLFSPFILLLVLLLAGSETALGQCTYTSKPAGGNFSNPDTWQVEGAGCPTNSIPASIDVINIVSAVILDINFTVSGTPNGKESGVMIISKTDQSVGSLKEVPEIPRTLTIDRGTLDIKGVGALNTSQPQLDVSQLNVNHTQVGQFIAKMRIGSNSTVKISCLMLGNQGGIDLAQNAHLIVGGNIDVQTGNGSINGTALSSLDPADVHIVGEFTGVNGGTRNVFSGNLTWCMEGVSKPCVGTGPVQDPPTGGNPFCRPLPVTLIRFAAQARPSGVKLDWATATELNNDYFEVQRSPDGRGFVPIGRVAGMGTTSTGATYSFTDTAPLAGPGYYRLRQTDHDGSTAFSAVVTVAGRQQLEAIVYPNPGTTTITMPASAGKTIDYRIYTATGRTVLAGHMAGGTSFDVQQIPAGLYLIELITDGQRHVQRFVRN